jgi:hypothetical protein
MKGPKWPGRLSKPEDESMPTSLGPLSSSFVVKNCLNKGASTFCSICEARIDNDVANRADRCLSHSLST